MDNIKNFVEDMSEILTGNVRDKEMERENIRKSCKLITFILIIICTAVILCDYCIF